MTNRLASYNINMPKGYRREFFIDELSKLIAKTKLRVEDNMIQMGYSAYDFEIVKAGKRFTVEITALLGEVDIDIKEITS